MCHVLIIEDDVLVAFMIEDVLRGVGATSFDIAEDEEEAVRLAQDNPPGFITADVMLKAGLGPSAADRIRSAAGNIAAVVISGEIKPTMPLPPVCHLLSKPFNPDELETLFIDLAPM